MITTHVSGLATEADPRRVWAALYVDKPGGAVDDEVEDHWLSVLADLHALLAGAEVR